MRDKDLRWHGDRTGNSALNFAVNIWPGDRSASLQSALSKALENKSYPDEREATAATALRHGRPPHEVLLLNGASEASWLLAHTLRPQSAVCIHPSFTEPEAALRAVNAEIMRVLRQSSIDWRFDPRSVPEEPEVVVAANPNNPTGTLDQADAIASLARPGRVLVVDESFMPFVAEEQESLASRRDLPGVVVVRSLTKMWSLAGIRAGYLLGPPEVVAALKANRQPWSVNALACAALVSCAEDAHTTASVAAEVAEARERFAAELHSIGIKVWPSVTNFLLLEVPDGPTVVEKLKAEGILVRPAASFPGLGKNHIRVAVRSHEENMMLAQALSRAVGSVATTPILRG